MGATPDYNGLLGLLWGWPTEEGDAYAYLSLASNVLIGTNPAYASTDFYSIYPQFTGLIPTAVLNAYIALATASVMQLRWQDGWYLGMANYIAHFCTLWLQATSLPAGATGAQVAAAGLAFGIKTSKAAGNVSVGYKPIEFPISAGAWQLTVFGQLFYTSAMAIGSGNMLLI